MEAIRSSTAFSLGAARSESSESTSNGKPTRLNQNAANRAPLLSISKPSWIVRTESNVRKMRRKTPDPPCVNCEGSGRVDCYHCNGRGRTNDVEMEVLPKGKWPKWCRICRGSGLIHCNPCLGTGEYRHTLGFDFTRSQSGDDEQRSSRRRRSQRLSADDLLRNNDE